MKTPRPKLNGPGSLKWPLLASRQVTGSRGDLGELKVKAGVKSKLTVKVKIKVKNFEKKLKHLELLKMQESAIKMLNFFSHTNYYEKPSASGT